MSQPPGPGLNCCGNLYGKHFESCGESVVARKLRGQWVLMQIRRDGSQWYFPGQQVPQK